MINQPSSSNRCGNRERSKNVQSESNKCDRDRNKEGDGVPEDWNFPGKQFAEEIPHFASATYDKGGEQPCKAG